MEHRPIGVQPHRGGIDLANLKLRAKVDFVTLRIPRKVRLPKLLGSAKWPRSARGKVLTIHDLDAADVPLVVGAVGDLQIAEIEIAVDIRPAAELSEIERRGLLERVMVDVFARHLDPSAGIGMTNEFRAFYRPHDRGYTVGPFNMRLPDPYDQQLHGRRGDDAQVKAYLKQRDQLLELPPARHCARVEVRLAGQVLQAHGLLRLSDLSGFRFRTALMPYFRHVDDVDRRPGRRRSPGADLIRQAHQHIDRQHFKKVGVGAFTGGGRRASLAARLRRAAGANHRIGQALGRLEERFRAAVSVQKPRADGMC